MNLFFSRPGGELVAGEDEIDGLKRSMTEVRSPFKSTYCTDMILFCTDLFHKVLWQQASNLQS